jgi:hypothetical protein
MGRARHDVSWVNIWQDPEAAIAVAGHRDGFETVPTVVTGNGRMIPATASAIREHLTTR